MKKVIACLLLVPCYAFADTSIGFITLTAHTPQVPHTTGINPGMYVEHDGFTVGMYRNSYKSVSTYMGYNYHITGNASVMLGGITGYAACSRFGGVCPGIAGRYTIPITNNLRVGVTSSFGFKTVANNLTFQYDLK